jgi:hypothetical protein
MLVLSAMVFCGPGWLARRGEGENLSGRGGGGDEEAEHDTKSDLAEDPANDEIGLINEQ